MKIICDICRNDMKFEFKFNSDISYYRCVKCCYLKRIPDNLQINYSTEYMNFDLISKSKNLAANYYHRFKQYVKPGSKTLEIGGSFGFFSNFLKLRLDCDAYNVDSSAIAIDYSNKLGVKSFEKIEALENSKFDIIFSFHVLEHIEPQMIKPLIENLCKLLNNNGTIILVTPNANTQKIKIFNKNYGWLAPQEHISFLSQKSIIELFKGVNYSSLQVKSAIPSFFHYPAYSFLTKIRKIFIRDKVSGFIQHSNSFTNISLKSKIINLLKKIFHISIFIEQLLFFPFFLLLELFTNEHDELIIILKK